MKALFEAIEAIFDSLPQLGIPEMLFLFGGLFLFLTEVKKIVGIEFREEAHRRFMPLSLVLLFSGLVLYGAELWSNQEITTEYPADQLTVDSASIDPAQISTLPQANDPLRSNDIPPSKEAPVIASQPQDANLELESPWPYGNASITGASLKVYSEKPSYSGLFGLGSVFSNEIKVRLLPFTLPKGTRIRILRSWTTPIRKYMYVEIQYYFMNTVHRSWAFSGKKPNYWRLIEPDNKQKPYDSPVGRFPGT